jgi:hypothetical protein
MRIRIKLLLSIFLLFFLQRSFSQGIAIGEWRDHLPYSNCVSVTEGDGRIYCATKYAVFYLDKSDNSIHRMTKVNYLSDIGVSRVAYHKSLKTLVVTYTNGNIDLIENDVVTNLSDIKRKIIPGLKSINNILFIDKYAYLSCGFGIVVLDVERKEINNTYYIGLNGAHINVLDMTTDGTKLYAATESGVYEATLSDPNLSDYHSWTKHTEMPHPDGKFNCAAYFHNTLYVNYSCSGYNDDTLYTYKNGIWNYYDPAYSFNKFRIKVCNDELVVVNEDNIDFIDSLGHIISRIYTYNWPGITSSPAPRDAIIDENEPKIVWIADANFGMIKNVDTWSSTSFYPNGPSTTNALYISVENSNLWVAPGGHDETWNNIYNGDGIFSFINEEWKTYSSSTIPALDTIYDFITIKVNPANPADVFAGSWSRGLVEFYNQSLINVYDEKNSTLMGNQLTYPNNRTRVGGIAFDASGNMWVTNSGVNTALNVKRPGTGWTAFNFSGYVNNNEVGDLVIDKNNYKWIILPRNNGMLVFDDNNTISNITDDNLKKLSSATGNGALPSNNVYSIARDNDGEIWVGTDKGVAVFYNPENVFSGSNFDSQQILVDEGGFIQPLLESEIVTTIAVDGDNRKWIGTLRAGAFLMSDDGTKQLLHFTEDNSPLFSNTVNCISIDQKTGEVFFGTDKGIISYKGTATAGDSDYTEVVVYPNPVTKDYNGYIAIKGLVDKADVKITDITGTLIYQTVAEGGQAVWNGKNYSGERAKSGVYLVFCSNSDGSKTLVTKIMIVN